MSEKKPKLVDLSKLSSTVKLILVIGTLLFGAGMAWGALNLALNRVVDNQDRQEQKIDAQSEAQEEQQKTLEDIYEQQQDFSREQQTLKDVVQQVAPEVKGNSDRIAKVGDLKKFQVKENQSWWEICDILGIEDTKLREHNTHIRDFNTLKPGTVIYYDSSDSSNGS